MNDCPWTLSHENDNGKSEGFIYSIGRGLKM
jgi:hypothetical protein